MYELQLEQAGALTSPRLGEVTRIVVERDVLMGNMFTDEEWANPDTHKELRDRMRAHPCYRLNRGVSSAMRDGLSTVFLEDDDVVREAMRFYALPMKEDAWRMHYRVGPESMNITWDEYRDKPDAWSRYVMHDNLKPYIRLYLVERGSDPDDALVNDFARVVIDHIAEASRIFETPEYLCYAFDHENPPPGWMLGWYHHPADRACLDYTKFGSEFGRYRQPPIRGN